MKTTVLILMFVSLVGCQSGGAPMAIYALQAGDYARGVAPLEPTFIDSLPPLSLEGEGAKTMARVAFSNGLDYSEPMWVIRDALSDAAYEESAPSNLVGEGAQLVAETAAQFLPPPYNILALGAAGLIGSLFGSRRRTT